MLPVAYQPKLNSVGRRILADPTSVMPELADRDVLLDVRPLSAEPVAATGFGLQRQPTILSGEDQGIKVYALPSQSLKRSGTMTVPARIPDYDGEDEDEDAHQDQDQDEEKTVKTELSRKSLGMQGLALSSDGIQAVQQAGSRFGSRNASRVPSRVASPRSATRSVLLSKSALGTSKPPSHQATSPRSVSKSISQSAQRSHSQSVANQAMGVSIRGGRLGAVDERRPATGAGDDRDADEHTSLMGNH
jgi:hypothetical protein